MKFFNHSLKSNLTKFACVLLAFATLTTACSSSSSDVDKWPNTEVIEVSLNTASNTEDFIDDDVTIINLWALWCAPCREELPRLQTVSEQYSKELSVVGVNIGDDFGKTIEYISEAGLTFPMYWDETGELLTALKIPSVPATLAVNADGEITWFHLGALSQQELDTKIASLVTS